MMNGKEIVVGKRKSKLSSEPDQPPNKKHDSPRSFSGDEAYYSFSFQSCRGDETDGSSCEDIHDIDEEAPQEISTESLQIFYKYLVANMEPLGVIDHLHHSEWFSDNFLEECKETPNRRRRNDLLIKEIYKIALNKDSAVLQLFDSALNNTDQSFIVDHLKKPPSDVTGKVQYRRSSLIGFINHMEDRLVDNIEPRDFIDDLLASKTISFNDHEDIVRLDLRKQRVTVIMEILEQRNSKSMEVTTAIINAYPKLFKEFERRTKHGTFDDTTTGQSKGGTAVGVRLHLKCGTGLHGRKGQLRKIEKGAVERFSSSKAENNVMIDELVEKCRCIFEGLKISSVVIHLLTRDGDSLDKILRKIQGGKAVDWLLSILDEDDKRMLSQIGVTTLQVSVSVDEEGNLSSLNPVKDCICLLDKQSILKNKETLAGGLTDTESLIHQMKSFGIPISQLKNLQLVKNKSEISTIILDLFACEDTPRVCFCLLEEHIKSRDPLYFESLFTNDSTEDVELSTSDIKQFEEFLKDELEVQMFLPIIRSWENTKSNRFLAKLSRCSCRSSRMAEFMKFLLREKDLTWFWEQVREKQKYVWDTIAATKRTVSQCKTDVLAVKLMNDTVVDEVDPLRLKQFMKETTIYGLAFDEFETIPSRKSQAQYMMNRISEDTIDDFMVALRRCGYERIYRQIKAGPLAKSYVCPRIHSANSRTKLIYKDQFDIGARLRVYENSDKFAGKDLVSTNQVEVEPLLHYSINRLTPPGSGELAMSPKSGFRSPASVGSTRDSESGIFSGSEGPACEIADPHDFDDEGISSCSPGASQELALDYLSEQKTEGIKRKSSRSARRERMLRLIDSDRSVSRGLLQRSLSMSTTRPTSNNCPHVEAMEENISDDLCETLSSQSNLKTPDKGVKNYVQIDDTKDSRRRPHKKVSSLGPWLFRFTNSEISETPKRIQRERVSQRRDGLRRTHSEFVKVPNEFEHVIGRNTKMPRQRLRYPDDDKDNVVPDRENGVEGVASSLGRKSQKTKDTLRKEASERKTPTFYGTTKQPARSTQLLACKDSEQEIKRSLKKSNTRKQNSLALKEGAIESDTPVLEPGKSNAVYKRSQSDTLKSGKHMKNIPHFVKSRSEIALAEYFDTRCSMKTEHEERSVSSPPSDRERFVNREEVPLGKPLPFTMKSYRKPSACEQSNETD